MICRQRDMDPEFIFVSMHVDQDDQIAHALHVDAPGIRDGVVISGSEDLESITAQLQGVDLVIGMRLHSIILAALGGVPAIAICYDEKVREVVRRLDLESFALAPDEVTSASVMTSINAILDNWDEIVEGLVSRTQQLHLIARDALAKCVQ